jgi:hypothetical protein
LKNDRQKWSKRMVGYDAGTKVEWDWGNGTACGEVKQRFTDKVSRTIKGATVTRKASSDEPAYLIRQEGGDEVLKSHSEVRKAS